MTGFWRFAGSAAVALVLIGLWQLGADAGLISPVFFPGPDRSFGTSRVVGCRTFGGPGREISIAVIREGTALMRRPAQGGARRCPS